MLRRLKQMAVPVAALVWAFAVVAGLGVLVRYEHTPGATPAASAAGAAPAEWPKASTLPPPDFARPTLVMSIHPQCPCSRASVEQLDRIMARSGGRVSAHLLAVLPPGAPPGFAEGGLVRSARAIPGVRVAEDAGGAESRLFGAETSGHVCLYAADGKRLFSGGVTASRGHAGDSTGADAIVALIGGTAGIDRTDVYGCALTDGRRRGATGAD